MFYKNTMIKEFILSTAVSLLLVFTGILIGYIYFVLLKSHC